jgi:hypothetical protein
MVGWESLRLFLKAEERIFDEETRNLCRTKRVVIITLFLLYHRAQWLLHRLKTIRLSNELQSNCLPRQREAAI